MPQQMKAKERFKLAAKKWNKVKETTEGEKYNRRAQQCPKTDPANMNEDDEKLIVKLQEQVLTKTVSMHVKCSNRN